MKLFIGMKALVRRGDGKMLIVRESSNYEEGTNAGRWDVVGGRIDPEEAVLDGLIREVKEESGLDVKVGKLLSLDEKFQEIKGETVHIVRIYHVCEAVGEEIVLSQDHDKYAWVDNSELDNYNVMPDVIEVFKKYE